MALTLANAIKNHIERSGLGVAAYRDAAPPDEELPFITISEGIAITRDRHGNNSSGSVAEDIQIDVWERWKDEDEYLVESPRLAADVQAVLHNARIMGSPQHIYAINATQRRRLLEERNNIVHNAITATVYRVS